MKPIISPPVSRCLAVLAAVSCLGLAATAAPSTKSAPAAEPAAKPVVQQDIPKSVFVIPSSPKEGRNPFFPYSAQPAPAPNPDPGGKNPTPVDASGFVLNGITSPPKRTAMINGRTFEPGEAGEVRTRNAYRVLIKCEEIRDDSAIINVDGKRIELRLRTGL